VFEEQVIVIAQAHTAQDDFIGLCPKGNHGHDLIVGLIRISKKRYLLSGYQGVVKVNTRNTGGNQFGGLFSSDGIDRWAADFAFFSANGRTAINGLSEGIKKAAGQLITNL